MVVEMQSISFLDLIIFEAINELSASVKSVLPSLLLLIGVLNCLCASFSVKYKHVTVVPDSPLNDFPTTFTLKYMDLLGITGK